MPHSCNDDGIQGVLGCQVLGEGAPWMQPVPDGAGMPCGLGVSQEYSGGGSIRGPCSDYASRPSSAMSESWGKGGQMKRPDNVGGCWREGG